MMENEFIESWLNDNISDCINQLVTMPPGDADSCARALIDHVLEMDSENLQVKRLVMGLMVYARK